MPLLNGSATSTSNEVRKSDQLKFKKRPIDGGSTVYIISNEVLFFEWPTRFNYKCMILFLENNPPSSISIYNTN